MSKKTKRPVPTGTGIMEPLDPQPSYNWRSAGTTSAELNSIYDATTGSIYINSAATTSAINLYNPSTGTGTIVTGDPLTSYRIAWFNTDDDEVVTKVGPTTEDLLDEMVAKLDSMERSIQGIPEPEEVVMVNGCPYEKLTYDNLKEKIGDALFSRPRTPSECLSPGQTFHVKLAPAHQALYNIINHELNKSSGPTDE